MYTIRHEKLEEGKTHPSHFWAFSWYNNFLPVLRDILPDVPVGIRKDELRRDVQDRVHAYNIANKGVFGLRVAFDVDVYEHDPQYQGNGLK